MSASAACSFSNISYLLSPNSYLYTWGIVMKDAIIKTEDLRFSYTTAEGVAPIVLDGVSLDIAEGSFVAVLGHNGSGKSTLAKHFNAILLPTGGKV